MKKKNGFGGEWLTAIMCSAIIVLGIYESIFRNDSVPLNNILATLSKIYAGLLAAVSFYGLTHSIENLRAKVRTPFNPRKGIALVVLAIPLIIHCAFIDSVLENIPTTYFTAFVVSILSGNFNFRNISEHK